MYVYYETGQDKGGDFQKFSYGSETLGMTSEGLGEMFEGDFADLCAKNSSFLFFITDSKKERVG